MMADVSIKCAFNIPPRISIKKNITIDVHIIAENEHGSQYRVQINQYIFILITHVRKT